MLDLLVHIDATADEEAHDALSVVAARQVERGGELPVWQVGLASASFQKQHDHLCVSQLRGTMEHRLPRRIDEVTFFEGARVG